MNLQPGKEGPVSKESPSKNSRQALCKSSETGWVLDTYQRAACPNRGRIGGRPWYRTCGHTAPAAHHHHSGSTHPLTAVFLHPWLCAFWFSSWPFYPFPLMKGMLMSRIKHSSHKIQTEAVIKRQTTQMPKKQGPEGHYRSLGCSNIRVPELEM